MIKEVYSKLTQNIYSLNYGYNILRSTFAICTLTVLLLNYNVVLDSAYNSNPQLNAFTKYDIFSILGFEFGFIFSLLILILVVTGFFPAITSFLHFYVSTSYTLHFSNICDGGDYLATLITFLLIPVYITDFRKNSWCDYSRITLFPKLNLISRSVNYNALRLLICIIYFHAGSSKFNVTEWYNGTAIYYFLNDPMSGNTFFIENAFFKYILSKPLFITIFTWGTLFTEILLSFMIFCTSYKYRKIAFALGLILHLCIIPTFFIPAFSFKMIACLFFYLLVLPKKNEIMNRSNNLAVATT